MPRELTHGKPFNYYPRGRVEIRNDEARIFINPLLNEERIIEYIKEQFNLKENMVGSVRVLVDNSRHYSSSQG
ncbi:MAG: hypothetical protein K6A14_02815 [Erysipelotrichaceae bacterium]|nr:hypothetical protein [Erysipelotrichaceae bacterium]